MLFTLVLILITAMIRRQAFLSSWPNVFVMHINYHGMLLYQAGYFTAGCTLKANLLIWLVSINIHGILSWLRGKDDRQFGSIFDIPCRPFLNVTSCVSLETSIVPYHRLQGWWAHQLFGISRDVGLDPNMVIWQTLRVFFKISNSLH